MILLSPFKPCSGINSLMPFLCISQGKGASRQWDEIIPSPQHGYFASRKWLWAPGVRWPRPYAIASVLRVPLPKYLRSRVILSALRWEVGTAFKQKHLSGAVNSESMHERVFCSYLCPLVLVGRLSTYSVSLTGSWVQLLCFLPAYSPFLQPNTLLFVLFPLLLPPSPLPISLSIPFLFLFLLFLTLHPPSSSFSSFYFYRHHVIFQTNTKSRENSGINHHVSITQPQQ